MQLLYCGNIHLVIAIFLYFFPVTLSWMPFYCKARVIYLQLSRCDSLSNIIDKRNISKTRLRAREASTDRSQAITAYASVPFDGNNNLDNSPTLVLNADYTPLSYIPLSVWCWQDTLRAVFSGKAVVVAEYSHLLIRSVSCSLKLPSVIALKEYHKKPSISPVMTKRYVYIRDNFRCQYCLEQFPPELLSLDHVVPRCRGGKLTWTNTVCACQSCNYRKGHLMPGELAKVGMRLKTWPYEPSHSEIQSKGRARKNKVQYHPDWRGYV